MWSSSVGCRWILKWKPWDVSNSRNVGCLLRKNSSPEWNKPKRKPLCRRRQSCRDRTAKPTRVHITPSCALDARHGVKGFSVYHFQLLVLFWSFLFYSPVLSLMKMFTLFPSQEFPLISGCFLFHLKNQSIGDIAARTQMIIFLIVWLAEKIHCRTKNLTTSSNKDHDANTSHQVYFLPCSNASTSKKVQGLPMTLQHSGAQASAFSVLPPLVSEWISYSRLPLPQIVQHWSFSHYVFNLVRKRG